tara:strand:- start:44 stop:415 length:372 start_codon:yes stop_codon:yes gene_type:complete
MKEARFEINKEAFKGPFKCHNAKTKLAKKKLSVDGNEFLYTTWQCSKCKKEYLDSRQAKRLETIWTFEKLLRDDVLSMKRSINYDGKMYFLRFPKELSRKFNKTDQAEIKVIDTKKFIIEVKP